MFNPFDKLLTVFLKAVDLILPEIPEETLDYAEILRPVEPMVSPQNALVYAGISAQYGWNTLANILRDAPEFDNGIFREGYREEQTTLLTQAANEIVRDIQSWPSTEGTIPLSRLYAFRHGAFYLEHVAKAYREKGTTLRLHGLADNDDMTNVSNMFSRRAGLANRTEGRKIAQMLNIFMAEVEKIYQEKNNGMEHTPPQPSEPAQRTRPPSPLKSRRAPQND